MKKIANDSIVTACSQRVSAIKQYLGSKTEIFIGQEEMKASDIAQVFQDALDTRASANTAKGALKNALVVRDAAEVKRRGADAALAPYILSRFGADSPEAHAFGYAAKKVAETSAVAKAKAALLGKATRLARGTTGKKAKQQIKGTLSPETAAALGALSSSSPASAPVVTSTSASTAPSVAPAAVVANGVTLNGVAHS